MRKCNLFTKNLIRMWSVDDFWSWLFIAGDPGTMYSTYRDSDCHTPNPEHTQCFRTDAMGNSSSLPHPIVRFKSVSELILYQS